MRFQVNNASLGEGDASLRVKVLEISGDDGITTQAILTLDAAERIAAGLAEPWTQAPPPAPATEPEPDKDDVA